MIASMEDFFGELTVHLLAGARIARTPGNELVNGWLLKEKIVRVCLKILVSTWQGNQVGEKEKARPKTGFK